MISASEERVRARVLQRFRLGLKTKASIGAGAFAKGAIMLVGEQTSHPEKNKYHAPFCSIKACSGWLNALLEEAAVPEERLFWINAIDNDGTPIDLAFLSKAIEPTAILALGNVAKSQLRKFGLAHEEFTHPQYHKRFHHKKVYPLIERLKELTRAV